MFRKKINVELFGAKEEEFSDLLKSVNLLDKFNAGKIKCAVTGKPITEIGKINYFYREGTKLFFVSDEGALIGIDPNAD